MSSASLFTGAGEGTASTRPPSISSSGSTLFGTTTTAVSSSSSSASPTSRSTSPSTRQATSVETTSSVSVPTSTPASTSSQVQSPTGTHASSATTSSSFASSGSGGSGSSSLQSSSEPIKQARTSASSASSSTSSSAYSISSNAATTSTVTTTYSSSQGATSVLTPTSTILSPLSTTSDPGTSSTLTAGSPSQNSTPTTSLEPTSTSTAAGSTQTGPTHTLTVNAGKCANVGVPYIIPDSDDPVDLVPLGNGQYSATLQLDDRGVFGAMVFLQDQGSRCGLSGDCVSPYITFDSINGLNIIVSRAGDRGKTMYPFSLWVDGGELYDGTPVDAEHVYNCWGWPTSECPFSLMYNTDARYTMSSTVQNASIHITFCPDDGPDLSDVPPNPDPPSIIPIQHGTFVELSTDSVITTSTFLVPLTTSEQTLTLMPGIAHATFSPSVTPAPTATSTSPGVNITPGPDEPGGSICPTTTGCIFMGTWLPVEETTTITSGFVTPILSIGPGMVAPTTYFDISTTTVVPATTVLGGQGPSSTSIASESSQTLGRGGGSSSSLVGTGNAAAAVTSSTGVSNPAETSSQTLSNPSATISPTSTLPSDPTIPSPTPAPSYYTITSWTTYMTVNGSTVPAIGGQVGVLTTIGITYALLPNTTIPVSVLSSLSVESTRTALPTALPSTDRDAPKKGNVVVGAVVGSLVGLALLGALFWMVCYRRRSRRRTDDYAASRSPVWAQSGSGSGSGSGSALDLAGGPRMREFDVEPFVPPERVQPFVSRKMREREGDGSSEEYGASPGAGPSREPESLQPGPSSSGSHSATSHGGMVPAGTRAGKTVIRYPEIPSPPPRPARPDPPPASLVPPTIPSRNLPPPPIPARQRYPEEIQPPRDNAIPPLYNEAWNVARPAAVG